MEPTYPCVGRGPVDVRLLGHISEHGDRQDHTTISLREEHRGVIA